MLADSPLHWNVSWTGGVGYDGGPPADFVATIPAGTHVWYRYTTRDGSSVVAWVPGHGWGFLPVGSVDRSRTGFWSRPEEPAVQLPC